jgi:two-component sensor histidine kinase
MEKKPLLYFYPKSETFACNRSLSELLCHDFPRKEKCFCDGRHTIATLDRIFYLPPPGEMARIKHFIAQDKIGASSYSYLRLRNTIKPAKLKIMSEHPERPRSRVRTVAVTPMVAKAAQSTMIDKLLQERELLLQEINHRVVNNLQVVLSIIHYSMTQKESDPAFTLKKIERHIFLLSSVHKCIYRKKDLIQIPVQIIIEDNLRDLKNYQDLSLEYHVTNSSATIEIKYAVPMAFAWAEFLFNLVLQNRQLLNQNVCLEINLRLQQGLFISVSAREKEVNSLLPLNAASADPVFTAILEQADAEITGNSTSPTLHFREKTDGISSLSSPIR